MLYRSLTLLLAFSLTACMSAQTYEEVLSSERATRDDIPNKEHFITTQLGLLYANAARTQQLNIEALEQYDSLSGKDVYDITSNLAAGNPVLGLLGLGIAVFNGLQSTTTNAPIYTVNRKNSFYIMGSPNTHYYNFDERPGTATAEEVRSAWSEGMKLFQTLYDPEKKCRLLGWNELFQYRSTHPKDIEGVMRKEIFRCPSPDNPEENIIAAMITSIANPFEGVRVVTFIETNCLYGKKIPLPDTRFCGADLAEQQRPLVAAVTNKPWLQLVVSAKSDDPSALETDIKSHYLGKTLIMPPTKTTRQYRNVQIARLKAEKAAAKQ